MGGIGPMSPQLSAPSLSVNSPALILTKNSGVFLAKIAQNRLKLAKIGLELAKKWLKSAKNGQVGRFSFHS